MHPWQKTIEINQHQARQLIESQFRLNIKTIRLMDSGWDNCAYLVNHKIIFRFPRRPLSVTYMDNEIALLPYIAQRVFFPISDPKWIGQASTLYPYSFSGYPILPGQSITNITTKLISDATFAQTLASWLTTLHNIPINQDHIALIKGDQSSRYDVNQRILRCEENLTRYEHYFSRSGFSKTNLQKSLAILPQLTFSQKKQAYLHGDLYCNHVIVNPKTHRPTGLIDWGELHIGHPGIDLAIGMVFTERVFKAFLKAYHHIDDETHNLMLLCAFCHTMSLLPYAHQLKKQSLIHWCSMILTRVTDEMNKR